MPQQRRRGFAIANAGFALFFAASAALQYNDPDGPIWMLLYGGAGVACWIHWRHASSWGLAALLGSVAAIWAFSLAPAALPGLRPADLTRSMRADTPGIELGRELFGLLIVAFWMAMLVRSAWTRRLQA